MSSVTPPRNEKSQTFEESSAPEKNLKYTSAERLFRLVQFLTANNCTRDEIFVHLSDYYKFDESASEKLTASRLAAERMLERDIRFLEQQGFEVQKTRATKLRPAHYHLMRGSGPVPIFLLTDKEVESLAFLHGLFADPNQYVPPNLSQPLPLPPARNPFAKEILLLIEKLSVRLSATQRKQFERYVKKPFVYFQISPVADYLPYRATINTIVNAISQRQQIQFKYAPTHGKQDYTFHSHIDPYYVIYMDGHFYLIGYSRQRDQFLEYRIDRIQNEDLRIQPDMIDMERRRRPIEFSYWIDGNIAKQGLSRRWLSQTQIREEVYLDEKGKPHRRVLVRATAYSEWRIVQQLLKYGDKAELVDPPHLRKEMQDVVGRMYRFYQKNSDTQIDSC